MGVRLSEIYVKEAGFCELLLSTTLYLKNFPFPFVSSWGFSYKPLYALLADEYVKS